ncbi:MAG: hypothetical protein JRD89_10520 [Deltaproteobacteria bacterium]|nr:hypothetical protein [Deltaproteobacteria bacterium]
MARIYRITMEYVGVADTDEETDFLEEFIVEGYQEPTYYATAELLNEAIETWRDGGNEPPERMVNLLREQIGNGEFCFTVAY